MTEKEILLRKLNEAFAKSDSAYISKQITDDIRWHIVGDKVITGRDNFIQALKEMESDRPFELTIHNIITHGKAASVNGTMRGDHSGTIKTYAFCDIYIFGGFKNPKITEITSYVLEVTE